MNDGADEQERREFQGERDPQNKQAKNLQWTQPMKLRFLKLDLEVKQRSQEITLH